MGISPTGAAGQRTTPRRRVISSKRASPMHSAHCAHAQRRSQLTAQASDASTLHGTAEPAAALGSLRLRQGRCDMTEMRTCGRASSARVGWGLHGMRLRCGMSCEVSRGKQGRFSNRASVRAPRVSSSSAGFNRPRVCRAHFGSQRMSAHAIRCRPGYSGTAPGRQHQRAEWTRR